MCLYLSVHISILHIHKTGTAVEYSVLMIGTVNFSNRPANHLSYDMKYDNQNIIFEEFHAASRLLLQGN